jgi:CBS domain-containing protein
VLVGIFYGVGEIAASEGFTDAATLSSDANVSPAIALIGWLTTINAFLFVFNLIPAFPLDGGRIARAIAWKLTGDRSRAMRFAARLGQIFSWILIGLGIAWLATGDITGGLWIGVLGWILGQAARSALAQTQLSEQLEGVTVADIMEREPVAVPATHSAERAQDEYFLRYYDWDWFPVVDAAGRPIGLIPRSRVDGALGAGDGALPVADLMEPAGERHIDERETLEELLSSEPLRRFGALLAVDREGVLRGVVTIDQVRRALAAAVAPPVTR